MDVERVAEVIRKAKAIIPHIKDEQKRKEANGLVNGMERTLHIIRRENIPCPPELEGKFESAFKVIETAYNKTATN